MNKRPDLHWMAWLIQDLMIYQGTAAENVARKKLLEIGKNYDEALLLLEDAECPMCDPKDFTWMYCAWCARRTRLLDEQKTL